LDPPRAILHLWNLRQMIYRAVRRRPRTRPLAEAYLHGRELELAAETIRRAHVLTLGVASTRPKARLARTLALAGAHGLTSPIETGSRPGNNRDRRHLRILPGVGSE
jgi:hypothetical protein